MRTLLACAVCVPLLGACVESQQYLAQIVDAAVGGVADGTRQAFTDRICRDLDKSGCYNAANSGSNYRNSEVSASDNSEASGNNYAGSISSSVMSNYQQQTGGASRSSNVGPHGEQLLLDQKANRWYYIDLRDGNTYWADGKYRD